MTTDSKKEAEEKLVKKMEEEKKKPGYEGPTEDVVFDIGYGKGSTHAKNLINTSSIQLPNEKKVLVKGKMVNTGYVSSSALDSYTRCAYQYYLKYIKRAPKRLMPKVKMYGGIVVHDALDVLMKSKMDKHQISKETFLTQIEEELTQKIEEYDEKFALAKKENEDPEPMDFGANIHGAEPFVRRYISVGSVFYDEFLPSSKPVSTEKMFIHHLEVDSGGTLPLVGFIDYEGKIGGNDVILDYKVGAKKKQEDADFSQQLSIYSMATGIENVGITALQLGTTGGKKPQNAKPGVVDTFLSRRTVKDYARTTENINATLKGIKAGAFPRSGMHNPMVCARTQCEYFDLCLT